MSQLNAPEYQNGLQELRSKLVSKRGYGSRVADRLKVELKDVYNVAHGRIKNPVILQALVEEAKSEYIDPSVAILNRFLKEVA